MGDPTARPRRTHHLVPACAAVFVLLLTSCGGSSKPNTATQATPGGAGSGPQSLVDHLPPLGQFPDLHPITQPTVIPSPAVWVANAGLPGTLGQADAHRLSRLGFVAGVHEELGSDSPTTAEVDAQVEQFRNTAAAAAELRYRVGQARSTGRSPGYKFAHFDVSGVPGAVGYGVKQPASASDAVAFAAGPYFYSLHSVLPTSASNAVTPRQLSTEAVAWYRHLRTL